MIKKENILLAIILVLAFSCKKPEPEKSKEPVITLPVEKLYIVEWCEGERQYSTKSIKPDILGYSELDKEFNLKTGRKMHNGEYSISEIQISDSNSIRNKMTLSGSYLAAVDEIYNIDSIRNKMTPFQKRLDAVARTSDSIRSLISSVIQRMESDTTYLEYRAEDTFYTTGITDNWHWYFLIKRTDGSEVKIDFHPEALPRDLLFLYNYLYEYRRLYCRNCFLDRSIDDLRRQREMNLDIFPISK